MSPPFAVKIGINPISWSNDDLPSLGGETSLDVALTEGKAIGYQGFELGNKFPRESVALRNVLGAHGLDFDHARLHDEMLVLLAPGVLARGLARA